MAKGGLFHNQELDRIQIRSCKSRVRKDAHNGPLQKAAHNIEIIDLWSKLKLLFCDNVY